MLAIRHVAPSGHETLVETDTIGTEPLMERSAAPIQPDPDRIAALYYDAPGGERGCFRDGVAYVMNSTGRTIARYRMSTGDRPPASGSAAT